MYIIGGLIIVKLIHMRDSSVSTNAFAVFISLGVVILFTVIGIVSHPCVFQSTIFRSYINLSSYFLQCIAIVVSNTVVLDVDGIKATLHC